MLALEMLGRRAHNDHPNNFSRSPPYTEDVKWLLGLAAKLGKGKSHHLLALGPSLQSCLHYLRPVAHELVVRVVPNL